MSETEEWEPPVQLLEELAMSLRITDTLEHTTWFDRVDRRVLVLTFDPEEQLAVPQQDAPGWKQREHATAVAIVEDSDRFRPVVGTGVLRERGLEGLWQEFEAEADRRLAMSWLRSQGLLGSSD